MNIRRFAAPDMRTALRLVRETFGPDAVILETGRGAEGVEVSAAIDFDPAEWRARRPAPPVRAARIDVTDEEDAPAATVPPPAAPAPAETAELARLRAELRSLRGLLETQVARLVWDEQERRSPVTAGLIRNLTALGLTPDVVQRLARDTAVQDADDAWTASLRKLVDAIDVVDEDLVLGGGVFAIVGPTGVGKTTTIAKLAARAALRGSAGDVALVTTDAYRIGAREQLEIYGEILGVPVYQATDAQSLGRTLHALADRRLVLVDTAGMGPRDLRLAGELARLGGADATAIQVLLALPANAETRSMQEIVDAFLTAGPRACILTKLDEASCLGGALSVLIRTGLPLAYVTNGQRVPEDLHAAGARQAWLVKAAVELMRRGESPVNDDYLAEHFAEVATDACA